MESLTDIMHARGLPAILELPRAKFQDLGVTYRHTNCALVRVAMPPPGHWAREADLSEPSEGQYWFWEWTGDYAFNRLDRDVGLEGFYLCLEEGARVKWWCREPEVLLLTDVVDPDGDRMADDGGVSC